MCQQICRRVPTLLTNAHRRPVLAMEVFIKFPIVKSVRLGEFLQLGLDDLPRMARPVAHSNKRPTEVTGRRRGKGCQKIPPKTADVRPYAAVMVLVRHVGVARG